MLWSAIDIAVFVLCYGAGRWAGRIDAYLWVILSTNLVASFVLADRMVLVAIADLGCAAPLLFRDWRARFVAGLFVLMPLIYWFAPQFGVDRFTTYAIVAVLAYVQWAVAGHVNRLPSLVAGLRAGWTGNRGSHHSVAAREAEAP